MAKTDVEDHWGVVASGLLLGSLVGLCWWLFRSSRREKAPGGGIPIPVPSPTLPGPITPAPLPLPVPTPVVPLPVPTPVTPLPAPTPWPSIEYIPPQLVPLPPPEKPRELGEPTQPELPYYPVPELPPVTVPLLPEPRERYTPPIEIYPPPQLVPQPVIGDISLPGTMLGLTPEELLAMLGGEYVPPMPAPQPTPDLVITDGLDGGGSWGLLPFPGIGFVNPPALPGIVPSPGFVPVFP